MERQLSFAQSEYARKQKTTRRDKFLAEMEAVVPWARLVALIAPHYPQGRRGRPPIGVERMLRVYFLQQWYGLADEALEDTICDSQAMRGFVGVDLGTEGVPDATTLLHFRHLLERHELTRGLLDEVNVHLTERGLLLRAGTLVDATIIAAPSSTKNRARARDPEMRQTKKGNQWHFGMKAHIGADAGYTGVEKRAEIMAQHPKVEWRVARKRGQVKALAEGWVKDLTQGFETLKAAGAGAGGTSLPHRQESVSPPEGALSGCWPRTPPNCTRSSSWPIWSSPSARCWPRPGSEKRPGHRRGLAALAGPAPNHPSTPIASPARGKFGDKSPSCAKPALYSVSLETARNPNRFSNHP